TALLRAYIQIATKNVAAFEIAFEAGDCPFPVTSNAVRLLVEDESGTSMHVDGFVASDHSLTGSVNLDEEQTGLVKCHDLQGPIDDAFMSSFIVVTSSDECSSANMNAFRKSEQLRLIREWRRHFRGDAVVKADKDITDDDIRSSNLVLFGSPDSNSILRQIEKDLPIRWNRDHFSVGEKKYDAENFAPILIYPNPLNPNKYVVINSGFTFREYAYLNNARQVPMLPDWAIVDLRTPPNSRWPGKIVDAGFFDEQWKLKPAEISLSETGR
ncbi:MAG: hypothetical protein KDB27_24960, partial [Planctomycetales bacterium]|nr:hypothetical protein [Planctomycetales bacterium]